MKKSLFYISVLALSAACGDTANNGTPAAEQAAEETKAPACVYSYNEGTTEVLWVAYKFTEKTGVKGTFTSVNVTGVQEAVNPAMVVDQASFEINSASVSSGDATRDPKLNEHFFGKLADGGRITGKVTSVEGTETSGRITFDLSMNGVSKPLVGEYTVTGDKLEAKAGFSMSDWDGDEAIASLNEACKDLHKGPDGSSKLWPDITVFISTTLDKVCE